MGDRSSSGRAGHTSGFCMVFVVDSSPKKEVEPVIGHSSGGAAHTGFVCFLLWILPPGRSGNYRVKKVPGRLQWGGGHISFVCFLLWILPPRRSGNYRVKKVSGQLEWGRGAYKFCKGMWEWDNRRVGEWVKGENGGSSIGGAGYMDDFGMILG